MDIKGDILTKSQFYWYSKIFRYKKDMNNACLWSDSVNWWFSECEFSDTGFLLIGALLHSLHYSTVELYGYPIREVSSLTV